MLVAIELLKHLRIQVDVSTYTIPLNLIQLWGQAGHPVSVLKRSKRGGAWDDDKLVPTPLNTYNPPIIIYPDGKVSLVCTADAVKF